MGTTGCEKIAIIGIGCRMPPAGNSLATFWRFLMRGGNALRPIRADRWDWRQYYDEDPNRPGKSHAPKAASLDQDLRTFDPLAFGISPREAASLDPQQRLLLEVTWEAFEDAGLPLNRMSGSPTGVFIGGFCLDHLLLQAQASNRHLVNAHSAGGVMMTVLSNRISHAFNLRGPSLTLDTACSSSLVALHYACQSLRLRECEMAVAGGVNAMMRPEFPIIMSKGHFLSHHGECHTFDETAAGYARGEGAGVVLLKRLEDALEAGDEIYAVIRASGVNQDGHTDGISLPNSEAQEALLRTVYSSAGISPAEVDYVEAHGTGTQAGDSAELRALNRNFSPGRKAPLIVGSVKTNIGHLEAAAGVAGIIKTVGVLKHRQVPKNLHFKNPNPNIPFSEYCVTVAGESSTLPAPEEKPALFAAVNSFGYGGTNAHVVLESAPPAAPKESASAAGPHLIPLSAHNEEALRDLAGKFAFLLGGNLDGTLADLAYTTAFRRSHLSHRMVMTANNVDELREQLIAASTGEIHERVVTGVVTGALNPPLVFVFTGMGPQWWGMGQGLIRSERIVADTIDEIDAPFRKLSGWSLKDAMLASEAESRMARTELAQPANFALQVALTRLWEIHGVRPAAVIGHSVGEVTAAYAAGIYTLEEAVLVSYHRSRLQQTAAGLGSMLAVGLPEAEALELIANSPGVSIAAINSFNAVTLSGDTKPLKRLAAELEQRGVFNKFLRVEVAYHSPQMDPLREELLTSLASLAPKPARLPIYSTAHGGVVPGESWDAEYWWRNVRQPVRFAAAIQHLMEDGYSSFLEVGPHPVLGNSIKECAATLGRRVHCFTSLRRAEPEKPRFLTTLGELYCAGVAIDWSAVAPVSGRFIRGPQYPWKRQTHWVESDRSRMERLGLPGPVYLNRTVPAPNPTWEVEVNRNYFPFLFDHGVQDQTVFAGMGYVEAAIAVGQRIFNASSIVLENVHFERVLVVDSSKIQVLVTSFDRDSGRFRVASRIEGEEDEVQRQCRGRLLPGSETAPEKIDLSQWKTACPNAVAVDEFYDDLQHRGLRYGPSFRPTTAVFVGEDCFCIEIDGTAAAGEDEHPLHPTLFDAAIQPVLFCSQKDRLFVPFSVDRFEYVSRPGAKCFAVGRLLRETESAVVADVWLTDADGNIHAHARAIACHVIETETRDLLDGILHEMRWKPSPALDTADASRIGGTVIVCDSENSDLELAEAVAEEIPGATLAKDPADFEALFANGCRNVVVTWGSKATASAEAAAGISQRLIELFQAAARSRIANLDFTLVTRDACRVAEGDAAENAAAYPIAALALVAQNEFDSIDCRAIDLPAGRDANEAKWIAAEIAARSRGEIAYRDGSRFERVFGAYRPAQKTVVTRSASLDEPLRLRVGSKGRPEEIHFEPSDRREPGAGEVELRVLGVGINRADTWKVDGRFHRTGSEPEFWEAGPGMECAGEIVRVSEGSRFSVGDRVVALLPGLFQTYATVSDALVVKLPDGMDAALAGVPVAYLTAWRGLVEVAGLRAGERVFVHQASGGVGLAAIDIAQWIGAEVFASAGTEERRAFLREQGVKHVFSSDSREFGAAVRTIEGGVDVVIGAFEGTTRNIAMDFLREGGRFIELGRKDLVEDGELALSAFRRNLVFASVDLDLLARKRPEWVRETLEKIFERFAEGSLRQRRTTAVPAAEVAKAFDELSANRHVGKLWIDLSSGAVEVPDTSTERPLVRKDGTYLIVGGTAGFGLATAKWLATQGVGRVILASRSGPKAPGIEEAVAEMRAAGTEVEIVAADVSDPEQARKLIERAVAGPGVLRGIIHGAMVLEDAMLANLTPESFRRVYDPKARGAWNLATSLNGASETLDFFVFYSSISSLIGNRGQASYVAANSFLDGLAHRLRAQGVPATSVNWGALAESGVVARDEKLGAMLSTSGVTGLTDRQALTALAQGLRESVPQLGAFIVEWDKWFESHPKLADDPRFREQRGRGGNGTMNEAALRLLEELHGASREQRLRTVEGHLKAVLSKTLNQPEESIPVDRKLNEMGVDSLMVLELSLGIEEQIGTRFSAMEFLKGPTLEQLAAMAVARLWPS